MLRVCVLFGGANSEHEVSLRSASCILENLDPEKYEVIMVGITKGGQWLYFTGPVDMITTGEWQSSSFASPVVLSPDTQDKGLLLFEDRAPASVQLRRTLAGFDGEDHSPKGQCPKVIPIDIVIPVLHGKNGEDGTVQGLLELAGIPYVGCGVMASAVCMDKEICHYVLLQAGINKTTLQVVRQEEYCDLDTAVVQRLEDAIEYPMYVKPANAGSSVGISKAYDRDELVQGIADAFHYDSKVVVERTIIGREIECAVMGNETPVAAYPLGEIIPTRDFYDYEGKYLDDSADLVAPAELDYDTADTLRQMAVSAYKAVGCEGLARVDFFVEDDGTVVLNEINTFPGFTSISMFPRLFELDGVSIAEQVDRLIEYGRDRA